MTCRRCWRPSSRGNRTGRSTGGHAGAGSALASPLPRENRTRRLADIADARLDIVDSLSGSDVDAPAAVSTSRTHGRLAWASSLLLVGLAAAAVAVWATRPVPIPLETTRTILSIAPTGERRERTPWSNALGRATHPDCGRPVSRWQDAGVQRDWGGTEQLYARRMDQLSATPISGTSGGYSPFFSPDGQSVAFAAGGELRKVPLSGGPRSRCARYRLCSGRAGATTAPSCLRHSETGAYGVCLRREALPKRSPRSASEVQSPAAPLVARRPRRDLHGLERADLGRRAACRAVARHGAETVLVTGGSDGRYVSTGHLVYVRLGTLMAVPFDPVRLAVTGGATGVIDGVMQAANRAATTLPIHWLASSPFPIRGRSSISRVARWLPLSAHWYGWIGTERLGPAGTAALIWLPALARRPACGHHYLGYPSSVEL